MKNQLVKTITLTVYISLIVAFVASESGIIERILPEQAGAVGAGVMDNMQPDGVDSASTFTLMSSSKSSVIRDPYAIIPPARSNTSRNNSLHSDTTKRLNSIPSGVD